VGPFNNFCVGEKIADVLTTFSEADSRHSSRPKNIGALNVASLPLEPVMNLERVGHLESVKLISAVFPFRGRQIIEILSAALTLQFAGKVACLKAV
jgi:hypothetical protein